MLAKRIIPCLDVDRGQVVKGVHFVNLRPMGDPVECAAAYHKQGADELVFLDITATSDGRDTMEEVVRRTARKVFIPLTVGGGIRTVEDFRRILRAGADKVAVNSAAVQNPRLIGDAAALFGSQCVVVAIDAKRVADSWHVFVKGGREDTGIDLLQWATTCQQLGAGEILLTSMDADGTKNGFDLPMLRAVCARVTIPVIASGGCGSLADFEQVFASTGVDAALAASLFHEGTLTVAEVKAHLSGAGIAVRPCQAGQLEKGGGCA